MFVNFDVIAFDDLDQSKVRGIWFGGVRNGFQLVGEFGDFLVESKSSFFGNSNWLGGNGLAASPWRDVVYMEIGKAFPMSKCSKMGLRWGLLRLLSLWFGNGFRDLARYSSWYKGEVRMRSGSFVAYRIEDVQSFVFREEQIRIDLGQ